MIKNHLFQIRQRDFVFEVYENSKDKSIGVEGYNLQVKATGFEDTIEATAWLLEFLGVNDEIIRQKYQL